MSLLFYCILAGLIGIIARRCLARNWFKYSTAFIVPFLIMLTLYGIFPIGFDGKILSKVDDDILFKTIDDADTILGPITTAIKQTKVSPYEISNITIEIQPPTYPLRVASGTVYFVWNHDKSKFVVDLQQ